MSRPTRPPGPPPPDDQGDPEFQQPPPPEPGPPGRPPPAPPGRPQPRFTPRQPGREPAAHPQARPPQATGPQQSPPSPAPHHGPPRPQPMPPPPQQTPMPPAQPTFTPRGDTPPQGMRPRDTPRGDGARPDRSPRDGAPRDGAPRGGRQGMSRRDRDGRPRPTFTPREGYLPPPDGRRRVGYPPPQTAIMPPVPAGYPQQSYTQPFYPEAPERPAPRPGAEDERRPPAGGDHRPRVLEPPERRAASGPRAAIITQPNLARSSQVMALGTIASRATGYLRTFVLLAAIGSTTLGDAYTNSNTLPNTVYYLMLGGIFTSVVVPMLVRAAKEDPDRGEGYAERIFTLGVISLLLVTVVATLLSGPLVDLYAGNIRDPREHTVMVIFAYYFIPQIFFYGMDSLLGAILNVRGRFGPNMWTPVINNVVVILVGVLYIATIGLDKTADNISPAGIHLLAIGTTLGIVIQSVCLFPILRRAGFSMRLRFDLRRHEIGEIGRMGGWMFGYVASQALGNLIVQRVANAASNSAAHPAHGHHAVFGVGYAAYSNAWQLFQLPYAIVGISVISALLPRMSGHATDRRYSLVRDDFSKGVRLASVIVVPAAVFLAMLGPALCELLFAWGSETVPEARYIGEVFGVFSLGLVPFMLTQLQLRVFYSFRENRTPAVVGMVMLLVGVIGDLVALYALPASHTVIGLAAAYNLVTLTGAVISWPLLLRRVGSLDGWRITRSLVRMLLATLPGLAFIFAVTAVTGSLMHQGRVYGLVVTVLGGGGALLLYAFCARVFGIEEFRTLVRSLGGRFRHVG